jgi:restriction system protein
MINDPKPSPDESDTFVVRTPLFPLYSEVDHLIRVWHGYTKKSVLSMINAIVEQTGTPQDPVDWTNPDEWIGQRLSGQDRELAERTWAAKVNPRHSYGAYLFINSNGLLRMDAVGIYRITDDGERFLKMDVGLLRKLDQWEGIPDLLAILSANSPAKRGDLIEDWGAFLHARSKFGTPSTIKDTLRRRLLNLVERGLVIREINTYKISPEGSQYASHWQGTAAEKTNHSAHAAVKAHNQQQEQTFRDTLAVMDPYRFEVLIKDLLEAMDYEDVVVTKQSGDKGIDVVATYQFGITQIREVVQVKRQKSNVIRPILDQLRGALPYFQAIRGTIITLGGFANGCKEAALYQGAAPITLIDGDKLVELLVKHSVGIKKRTLTLVEVDDDYFRAHQSAANPSADGIASQTI